jgi:hypothetical protein
MILTIFGEGGQLANVYLSIRNLYKYFPVTPALSRIPKLLVRGLILSLSAALGFRVNSPVPGDVCSFNA